MRIPEDTVERIRQAADILEVVGDFVSLKRRGSNYIACCPFHNEKTPSFNVNPARQIYKCFGCGKAGDPVRFVMDVENLGYGEALRYLAKKYNIEIAEQEVTPEEQNRQTERESLYIALNYAKTFFQENLLQTDEGRGIGLSYFRERGFADPTLAAFDLGYSPDQWDALLTDATKKGYNPTVLGKAGLTIVREESGKTFDRFRGRVMFPIHNVSGRVIAFGARILKTDPKAPKYLNSPETDVYHKSQVLYGIFQAKQTIRQEDVCYLTEGYTDVISLHQAGIKNVVASSGTSLTIEQIRLISRFTPNVTILYDGDAAGVKAALRGLDIVLEQGLNVSIVMFPGTDDPDSYVRKVGAEEFKKYIKQSAKDLIEFKADLLIEDAKDDPIKRAEATIDVVNSINLIQDQIKRSNLFTRVARLFKTDETSILRESNKLIRAHQAKAIKDQETIDKRLREEPFFEGQSEDMQALLEEAGISSPLPEPVIHKQTIKLDELSPPLWYQEEECIRLLLNYGARELEPGVSLCHYILSELNDIDFSHETYGQILNLYRDAFSQGRILLAEDFMHQRVDLPTEQSNSLQYQAISLTTQRYEISENWEEKHKIFVPSEEDTGVLAEAAYGNILRMKKIIAETRMKELLHQIRTTTDAAESDRIMADYMHFKRVDVEIARLLGTVISG